MFWYLCERNTKAFTFRKLDWLGTKSNLAARGEIGWEHIRGWPVEQWQPDPSDAHLFLVIPGRNLCQHDFTAGSQVARGFKLQSACHGFSTAWNGSNFIARPIQKSAKLGVPTSLALWLHDIAWSKIWRMDPWIRGKMFFRPQLGQTNLNNINWMTHDALSDKDRRYLCKAKRKLFSQWIS